MDEEKKKAEFDLNQQGHEANSKVVSDWRDAVKVNENVSEEMGVNFTFDFPLTRQSDKLFRA